MILSSDVVLVVCCDDLPLMMNTGPCLQEMESLILHLLKWDLSAIVPNDFLDHVLYRMPHARIRYHVPVIKRHAQTFAALCATGESRHQCPEMWILDILIYIFKRHIWTSQQCLHSTIALFFGHHSSSTESGKGQFKVRGLFKQKQNIKMLPPTGVRQQTHDCYGRDSLW